MKILLENGQNIHFKKLLFLTQTDTIIGFVSQDSNKIDIAKKRLENKSYIKVVNSNKELQKHTRVPNNHKNLLRRAKYTTFIMPNKKSYRIVKNSNHNLLLNRLKWAYSSSANISGEKYNKNYAQNKSEVTTSNLNNKIEKESTIFQLSKHFIKKKIR